jgi:hypothetical protein
MTVEEQIGDFAVGSLLGGFDARRTKPLSVDDRDQSIGKHTPNPAVWLQIL